MFASVMAVGEISRSDRHLRIEAVCQQRGLGDRLQGDECVDGIERGAAPGERPVPRDQYAGDRRGVEVGEPFDDDVSGVQLVRLGDLRRSEVSRHRDRAVERVGVHGAEAGNLSLCLGERNGMRAVAVCDAADLGEGVVEPHVGGRVGGRAQVALDEAP